MKKFCFRFVTICLVLITLLVVPAYARNDWYCTQFNSGVYFYENCGPATATMTVKWYNPEFEGTVEDARSAMRPNGGVWFAADISNYIKLCGVKSVRQYFPDVNAIVDILQDDILILCVDIGVFSNGKATNYGHFIIAKGYEFKDDQLWLVIHDPWYGENMLYPYTWVNNAVQARWSYCIRVFANPELEKEEAKELICPLCGGSFAEDHGVNLYTATGKLVSVVCSGCAYDEEPAQDNN